MYILLSKSTLREIDAHVGDSVEIRFRIADQNAVDVPPVLASALNNDLVAQALWEKQTPGKRRALCYRVSSAKTETTQLKRVREVFDVLFGKRDLRGK